MLQVETNFVDKMSTLQAFCDFYQQLDVSSVNNLDSIYSEDIHFIDPVTEHRGLEVVRNYFVNMLQNTRQCEFDIVEVHSTGKVHFITWTMRYIHPKLGSQTIHLNGISQLRVSENKVAFQRDYYDLGEMLYEHVFGLGAAVRFLKKRLAA